MRGPNARGNAGNGGARYAALEEEQKLLPNEANEALQTSVMKPVEKDPTVVQHASGETPLPDAAQPSEENMQRTEFGVEVPVFRDVPGLPVKVGEAPAVEQTGKEMPVKAQLFERLTRLPSAGKPKWISSWSRKTLDMCRWK